MSPPDGPVVTAADRVAARKVLHDLQEWVTVEYEFDPPAEKVVATALAAVRADVEATLREVRAQQKADFDRVTALEGALREVLEAMTALTPAVLNDPERPGYAVMPVRPWHDLVAAVRKCWQDRLVAPGAGGTA
jgi:uncharacterized protein YqfA (UPF0365 family)